MFGSYRFLLAHLVVCGHLLGLLWPGPYAVFSFWMLSGYLMTLVLHRRYGFAPRGVARYLANRALRIYPPYLASAALASAVVLTMPQAALAISAMRPPDDAWMWLRNLALLGLHFDRVESSRLVPPAWSVDIELWFYVALGLGLARSRRVVDAWLAGSAVLTAGLVLSGLPFNDRYANLAAASLPYAAGAALFHHRERLHALLAWRGHAALAPGLYLAHAAFAPALWGDAFREGFYGSAALTAYALAALGRLEGAALPGWLARADRVLGDLSYPLFLCHLAVAALLVWLGLAERRGPELLAVGLVPANLLALVLHATVERPLERLRRRVREAATAEAGP